MPTRAEEQLEKAVKERAIARDWLLRFMEDGQPRPATKEELCVMAMRNFGISKNSFNYGWIDAIEAAGRHDWYEPLPRRTHPKQ